MEKCVVCCIPSKSFSGVAFFDWARNARVAYSNLVVFSCMLVACEGVGTMEVPKKKGGEVI